MPKKSDRFLTNMPIALLKYYHIIFFAYNLYCTQKSGSQKTAAF